MRWSKAEKQLLAILSNSTIFVISPGSGIIASVSMEGVRCFDWSPLNDQIVIVDGDDISVYDYMISKKICSFRNKILEDLNLGDNLLYKKISKV